MSIRKIPWYIVKSILLSALMVGGYIAATMLAYGMPFPKDPNSFDFIFFLLAFIFISIMLFLRFFEAYKGKEKRDDVQ